MPSAQGSVSPRCAASTRSFGRNSAGTFATSRPSASFSWLVTMITAMPLVKPVTSGCGMNRISVPVFNSPAAMSITPAISVASTRPS